VIDCGDFDGLVGRRLDAASRRDLLEFKHCGCFVGGLKDKVDLVQWATCAGCWIGDPIAYTSMAFMFVWVLGDTGRDRLPSQFVGGMLVDSQVHEPLPIFGCIVPDVLDSGASGLREGAAFSHAPHS
jgi:hypothetical protein